MVVPVMYDESSDARKAITLATSTGSPYAPAESDQL